MANEKPATSQKPDLSNDNFGETLVSQHHTTPNDQAVMEAAAASQNQNNSGLKKTTEEEKINVADAPIVNHFTSLIAGELNLINNRITWMMTFQGFLFAAYAVAMSKENDDVIRELLLDILPLVGMFVAFFTNLGIAAAYSAITDIKRDFKSLPFKKWTAPYSNHFNSILGRIAAFSYPTILIITWIFILYKYSPVKINTSQSSQVENIDSVKPKPDSLIIKTQHINSHP